MSPCRKLLVASALTAWIALVAVCFAALERYAATAGAAGAPTARAAEFLAQQRQTGRALVVMAVHPRCPCTEASLAELGDLLARSRGGCDAVLLEYRPQPVPADWPEFSATRELGGVPVKVIADPKGETAAMLGAETSGHTVFVDSAGAVRFHGGITLARGHRGVAPAQTAILESISRRPVEFCGAPVFGCALDAPHLASSPHESR